MIVAAGILAVAIEIFGFVRGRTPKEDLGAGGDEKPSGARPASVQQKVLGSETNIAGDVHGPVLSGQFNGPVAPGGEAVDLRGSPGAMYKPTFNIQTARESISFPSFPEPPRGFTGREEELKELLKVISSGTNIIGLRGIGGVGKTALALKLVESIKDRYPDGQIMVDMMGTTNPISPVEAMAFVIHSYHREEKIPEGEAEIRRDTLRSLTAGAPCSYWTTPLTTNRSSS